ncbi:MAG: hypothetical protein K2Y42_18135 [Hyphomicrobium sp.]|uniref:hypothetical protein n=1 Tax=Hyphomicrobium sp. TaxID=82 RepID=UPI0025BE73AB|nr:hypothetical protein [Hyphomicrobium sp.]MBX9864662.1 hypothetical protein [Hyphomicrobium sp.]
MDDLRKFALDMAATSMRGAPFTEIVLAAQAFHAFLVDAEGATHSVSLADLAAARADARAESIRPPPIPDLVQQVAAARADLSDADQTPTWLNAGSFALNADGTQTPWADDDAKTRLIHRAHVEQFSEAK